MHKTIAIVLIVLIAAAGCASGPAQENNNQIQQQSAQPPSLEEVSALDSELESLSDDLEDSDFEEEFTQVDESTFN